MQPQIEFIKSYFKSVKDFGLKFTLESGINTYFGTKHYSKITYPFNGIQVIVRSHIFWKTLEAGKWETNCIKYLPNVVRKGQTILDVGAWIGPYTLLFSKLVQTTGQVFAFEPDSQAFHVLRDNIEKNRLSNVRLEKLCVSNFVEEAKFYPITQFGASFSSLIPYKNAVRGLREIVVQTTTIDKYCEENDVCPDGIKIDVEGAEAFVIEGCRNTIKKCCPWILLEFHGMLMPERQRKKNWDMITRSAKKVVFLDGAMNHCCHVFLRH